MPKINQPIWISADDHKPKDYELCKLLTKESFVRVGWWTGHAWDGLNVRQNQDVLMWQKHIEGYGV